MKIIQSNRISNIISQYSLGLLISFFLPSCNTESEIRESREIPDKHTNESFQKTGSNTEYKKKIKANIYFIRHTHSTINDPLDIEFYKHVLTPDTPVSTKGNTQLVEMKRKINCQEINIPRQFDLICTSSLKRCIWTSYNLFQDIIDEIYVMPYLKEKYEYWGNYPPKGKGVFINKYSIEEQMKYFPRSMQRKLNYKFVTDCQNPKNFDSATLKSDLPMFIKFLNNNIHNILSQEVYKDKEQLNIMICCHGEVLKEYFSPPETVIAPNNLSILKTELELDPDKYSEEESAEKIMNELKRSQKLVFDGYKNNRFK